MSATTGKWRFFESLGQQGDLLLLAQLKDLEFEDIARKLVEIVVTILVPLFDWSSPGSSARIILGYLEYLKNLFTWSDDGDQEIDYRDYRRRFLAQLLCEIYGSLPSSNEGRKAFADVRMALIENFIVLWSQTKSLKEAESLFSLVAKEYVEGEHSFKAMSDKKEKIEALVREKDGSAPRPNIVVAMSVSDSLLPDKACPQIRGLLEVLGHRWVKGLESEQIPFLARVNSQFSPAPDPAQQEAMVDFAKWVSDVGNLAGDTCNRLLAFSFGRAKLVTFFWRERVFGIRLEIGEQGGDDEKKKQFAVSVVDFLQRQPDLPGRARELRVAGSLNLGWGSHTLGAFPIWEKEAEPSE